MNDKWIVIGAVAVAVLLLARRARSEDVNYPFYPQNWRTLPGYTAAQGGGVMM